MEEEEAAARARERKEKAHRANVEAVARGDVLPGKITEHGGATIARCAVSAIEGGLGAPDGSPRGRARLWDVNVQGSLPCNH
eukprot:jgi/Tetstr1/448105/TSEL_035403.t1